MRLLEDGGGTARICNALLDGFRHWEMGRIRGSAESRRNKVRTFGDVAVHGIDDNRDFGRRHGDDTTERSFWWWSGGEVDQYLYWA